MFNSYQIEDALRRAPELLVNQHLWSSWTPPMLATGGFFVGMVAAAAIGGSNRSACSVICSIIVDLDCMLSRITGPEFLVSFDHSWLKAEPMGRLNAGAGHRPLIWALYTVKDKVWRRSVCQWFVDVCLAAYSAAAKVGLDFLYLALLRLGRCALSRIFPK